MPTKHGLYVVAVSATTEVIRGSSRVRVNEAYTRALTRVGLVPLVVPPMPFGASIAVMDVVDGLVLTGGEDVAPERYDEEPHPSVHAHDGRDDSEMGLYQGALARHLPTLAICRGIQLVNVAEGGSLIQDIPTQCPSALLHDPGGERDARVHEVVVEPSSVLAQALGVVRLTTNSFHHQALDRLGHGLRITARATDGVVEAIEHRDATWWMLGVQWHPEELIGTPEPWDRSLFSAFAAAVRAATSREPLATT